MHPVFVVVTISLSLSFYVNILYKNCIMYKHREIFSKGIKSIMKVIHQQQWVLSIWMIILRVFDDAKHYSNLFFFFFNSIQLWYRINFDTFAHLNFAHKIPTIWSPFFAILMLVLEFFVVFNFSLFTFSVFLLSPLSSIQLLSSSSSSLSSSSWFVVVVG